MSIKYVMLGFLSEEPLTGYDLKKKFSSSEIFYWSGNNNQIYRALVELHDEGLVSLEVQQQASKPPRKIYRINEAGQMALNQWMQSPPDLPQFHSALMMQLTWADQLQPEALDAMLASYEDEVQAHLVLIREQAHRSRMRSQTPSLRQAAADHLISFYELELEWVRTLRRTLHQP